MAVTVTHLTSSYDNVDRSLYTTASISPTASRWLVLDTFERSASDLPSPTVTGLSLTWINEASRSSSQIVTVTRFYAWTGTSPGSGTISIDYGAGAVIGAGWAVYEIGGVNLSDPFLQTASTSATSGASVSVTLAAFNKGTNRPLICAFHNVVEGSTPDTTPSAYTEVADVSGGTPNAAFAVAWNSADTDTTPSYSWAGAPTLVVAIASEIDEGAVAGGATIDPFGMSGFFGV